MVVKKRVIMAVLIYGVDYVIDRRAVKKAVKRMRRIVKKYEKYNAEKLAVISMQEEYLACFDEYIKKYHRDYYNSIHRERRI